MHSAFKQLFSVPFSPEGGQAALWARSTNFLFLWKCHRRVTDESGAEVVFYCPLVSFLWNRSKKRTPEAPADLCWDHWTSYKQELASVGNSRGRGEKGWCECVVVVDLKRTDVWDSYGKKETQSQHELNCKLLIATCMSANAGGRHLVCGGCATDHLRTVSPSGNSGDPPEERGLCAWPRVPCMRTLGEETPKRKGKELFCPPKIVITVSGCKWPGIYPGQKCESIWASEEYGL